MKVVQLCKSGPNPYGVGVGVSAGVGKMLKFYVQVFESSKV